MHPILYFPYTYLYMFLILTGHRWNCTEVWNKDVFGHVVIVGKQIYANENN